MKEKYSESEMNMIAEVARMYYEENLPQTTIGKRMFFSKSKVCRYLQKAKELKIVEIQINYPLKQSTTLETMLKEKYQLKDAIVITDSSNDENKDFIIKRLGEQAAKYIDGLIKDGDSVGISWGRTLNQMVQQMKPKTSKKVRFVQLTGGSAEGYHNGLDTANLVRKMTEKYNGTQTMLYAPLYVESDIVREELMKEPIIRQAFKEINHLNYIITGIASIRAKELSGTWAGFLNDQSKEAMIKKGAIGYMCGHFFDVAGNPIDDHLEKNIIGIQLDQIRKNQNVIAIAGGVDKARAIHAALVGGYINYLITDSKIAEKILSFH